MKWRKVKNGLPKNKKLCLFIQWSELNQTVIEEYVGTLEDVQNFREYQLKNDFTHWTYLSKPQSK